MAKLNSVHLIGQIASEPTTKLEDGYLVWMASFVTEGRRRKTQDGWKGEPMYVEIRARNTANGTLADLCANRLGKGDSILVDGSLVQDEARRLVVEARNVQWF